MSRQNGKESYFSQRTLCIWDIYNTKNKKILLEMFFNKLLKALKMKKKLYVATGT